MKHLSWIRLSLIDLFSKKTILIKEVPRVHQDDLSITTEVPYAFGWSYSPSKLFKILCLYVPLKLVLIIHYGLYKSKGIMVIAFIQ